jgi:ubiquinone biosynthesis monooxygenase Coq7
VLQLTRFDELLSVADRTLRTLAMPMSVGASAIILNRFTLNAGVVRNPSTSSSPLPPSVAHQAVESSAHLSLPSPSSPTLCVSPLEPSERQHAAGLMRVNHVGEVCAQALYLAQGLGTSSPQLKAMFWRAADEELAHLSWTAARIVQLQSHRSYLNPVWFAGAFAIGAVASRWGDAVSLGFMAETEHQVAAHLQGHLSSHLQRLPEDDVLSREIVQQMHDDELAHAHHAQSLGAHALPAMVRYAMRGAAMVMTTVAYYI